MKSGSMFRMGVSLLAVCLSGLAFPAQPATTGEPVVLGQRFSMYSAAKEEERSYLVHRPANYDISTARYPVIYVTDGNEHFQQVSATVDFLAQSGKIPPIIVVGIPNVVRGRDLLGHTVATGPSRMLKFVTNELVPKIDHDYRTSPYRILTGWSDGGLFALHSMIEAPGLFRGYIVTSLALGDDRNMPAAIRTFFDAHPKATINADFFLAMDDVTGVGLSWAEEMASILQFRAGRVRDLRFTFRHYTDESHGSAPLRGVQEGLRTIFAGWEIDDPLALYDQGGLAAIEKHFASLSQRLGFPVPVSSDALFYTFTHLEGPRNAEAEPVIKRAVELYPANTTGLYYLARLYMRTDRKPLAIDTLRKALQMSPNDTGAISMLKEMGVDAGTEVATVHLSEKDLARYVGSYGNPAVFEVELRGDKLYGRTAEQQYEFAPLSGTRFHYSEKNVYLDGGDATFKTDARGRATALVFENGGPELAKSK
jgi:uncharacterized protein